MHDQVIEAIESVTLDVFARMIGVDVAKEAECTAGRTDQPPAVRVVCAFNLTGAVTGTAKVYYSLPLAEWMTSQMLQMKEPLPCEQVLDASGEIANMIVGGVKHTLERLIGPMQIGTPAVAILGADTPYEPVAKGSTVAFRCRETVFDVSISFQPALA